MLSGYWSWACGTETGFYNFSFTSDNLNVKPFTVCFQVTNRGAEKPFLEQGSVAGFTTGPYGSPGGTYNIKAPKALSIYMDTYGADRAPQYQYQLTGEARQDNIVYTRNSRYMIALATQPPPPQRGEAKPGSKPGGYSIVDTGSFSVTFIGTQTCS
jgi:hypothetical protein